MAQIDSVSIYACRVVSQVGYSVTLTLKSATVYTQNPSVGTTLGTATMVYNDLPLNTPSWVTFTFDSPIMITATGFYGILLTTPSAYASFGIHWYTASDFSSAATGEPYAGKEYGYKYDYGWQQGVGYEWAHKLNCTDVTDNSAETPTASYSLGSKYGFRSYLAPTGALGKATNPSPANDATNVSLNTETLSWTAGTGATSYNVYLSWWGGVSTLRTESTSITLSDIVPLYADRFSWGETYTWRVDSVNDAEEEVTGDTWSFTTLSFNPPVTSWANYPGKTLGPLDGVEGTDFYYTGVNFMAAVRRIVAAAADSIWYEDIGA
jgi:hypothetical protein